MAFAHQRLSDQPTLHVARAARLIVALACGALLASCAAFTEQVSNAGDRAAEYSATSAAVDADRASRPARYASVGMRYVSTASTDYPDRKTSRADRTASQRRTAASAVRTREGASTPSQVAHAKPPAANLSDSVATSEGGDARWDASAAAPALDVASIVFNLPTSMTLDRRTLIQLALATTGETRADAITPAATGAARRSGQYVEARLSGGDFIIEPVTAGLQPLRTARTTEWLWLVTPKKPGQQHLQVTVTALSDNDTGSAPKRRVLPTVEHTILVNTRWQDDLRARIETNAAWLWGTLLVAPPLLWTLYARWRRRHRRWFRSGPL